VPCGVKKEIAIPEISLSENLYAPDSSKSVISISPDVNLFPVTAPAAFGKSLLKISID